MSAIVSRLRSSLALLGAVLALGGVANSSRCAARDLCVDNVAGDDRFDGSPLPNVRDNHGPFQSIQRALRAAGPGDRIILTKNDEPYRESISLVGSRRSCSSVNPFVVVGNGAVLDGSRPAPAWAWEHVQDDEFRFRPEVMQFQQLFLDGLPAVRQPYSQLSGRRPQLEPLQWALIDGWIHFRVEHGKLPQDYRLTYAALPTGITMYKVLHVLVQDLTVQGYAVDGVNLNDAAGPCVLEGLTCRGNGRSGIAIVGASQANVRACLVGDNGEVQLIADGPAEVNLFNCDIIDASAPASDVRNGATIREDVPAVIPSVSAPLLQPRAALRTSRGGS